MHPYSSLIHNPQMIFYGGCWTWIPAVMSTSITQPCISITHLLNLAIPNLGSSLCPWPLTTKWAPMNPINPFKSLEMSQYDIKILISTKGYCMKFRRRYSILDRFFPVTYILQTVWRQKFTVNHTILYKTIFNCYNTHTGHFTASHCSILISDTALCPPEIYYRQSVQRGVTIRSNADLTLSSPKLKVSLLSPFES